MRMPNQPHALSFRRPNRNPMAWIGRPPWLSIFFEQHWKEATITTVYQEKCPNLKGYVMENTCNNVAQISGMKQVTDHVIEQEQEIYQSQGAEQMYESTKWASQKYCTKATKNILRHHCLLCKKKGVQCPIIGVGWNLKKGDSRNMLENAVLEFVHEPKTSAISSKDSSKKTSICIAVLLWLFSDAKCTQ